MKAALVGLNGNKKLYYDLDATGIQPDGIVEMENGDTMKVDFFSYVAASPNLKKLRTTAFHRRLWDEPQKGHELAWSQMFIEKTKKPTDKMMEDLDILTTLGKAKNKIKTKSDSVERFVKNKSMSGIQTKSCCGDQIEDLHQKTQVFSSNISRREAWLAMILLRDMEGQ